MNWQTNQSVVVGQGRCDAKGCQSRDAKTTYSDGHAYCFSCNTYFPAEFRHNLTQPVTAKTITSDQYPVREQVNALNCIENYTWLKKYGLSDVEIQDNFFYSPLSKRHVFAHKGENDSQFFEARIPHSGQMPKTLQYGSKPNCIMGRVDTQTLVIVEDIVSAIKVGRQYMALPMFGSFLSKPQMAKIGQMGLDTIVMWMDCDKYAVSMVYARDLGLLVPTVCVQTREDPKSLTDEAIEFTVNGALEAVATL